MAGFFSSFSLSYSSLKTSSTSGGVVLLPDPSCCGLLHGQSDLIFLSAIAPDQDKSADKRSVMIDNLTVIHVKYGSRNQWQLEIRVSAPEQRLLPQERENTNSIFGGTHPLPGKVRMGRAIRYQATRED
jgi:hypothetical protein